MVKKWSWYSQLNVFIKKFRSQIDVLLFPNVFVVVHIHWKEVFFLGERIDRSQFGTFSQQYFDRTFSNCRSHDDPAKRMTVQIPFKKNNWVLHTGPLFGKRTSGHPDFGTLNNVGASYNLTWVSADIASAARASHLGSLDPCSVNTAYDPESSFTMSPRSTTLPSCFWYWGSSSEFWRWQWPSMTRNELFCTCSLLR